MGTRSIPAQLDRLESTAPEKRLVVFNRTEPEPIQRMLEEAFAGEVAVSEATVEEADEDLVVLVEDDEVVTSSPLSAVMDSFLLINSDLFKTGVKGLEEYGLPEVLSGLDGTVLELRGYPATNLEKLLLIAVSRYIEGRALRAGAGRLDSAFQRLSRLDDEYGTRQVYERLAATDVDVHCYGVAGERWDGVETLPVNIHTGDSDRYRRAWFVVYRAPEPVSAESAALIAWEIGENVWRSGWTFEPAVVAEIQQSIVERF